MEHVWINNKMIPKNEAVIPFNDRGYYFGDGVYEVIRIYNGRFFLMNKHMKRLQRSAAELDFSLPFTQDEIEKHAAALISKNNVKDGYIYIQATRGEQERNHLYERSLAPVVTGFTKEAPVPLEKQKKGITLYAVEDIRWLRCDIKTINLLGNVMAKRKAEDNQAHEAIQHRGNIITEGSSTNVFIVQQGILYTHPATNLILHGITRELILSLAEEHAIPWKEEAFTMHEAALADEMFVSSTTMEITPVTKVEGTFSADYSIGTVTRKLQQAFQENIRHECF
ncbi:D-amino-acid transaminase [Alteribacillus sp. HJP-4]|uniref:D-amino-acid transaminase n=1 Tax=Alteribacillus sp. HJP-4 TaxID=2775394 RepID=UPI0035CD334B